MTRYKIRKTASTAVGHQTWKQLYHRHEPNGTWHGPIAESSHWRNIVWIATGEPTYRMPGYMLWPTPCYQ